MVSQNHFRGILDINQAPLTKKGGEGGAGAGAGAEAGGETPLIQEDLNKV